MWNNEIRKDKNKQSDTSDDESSNDEDNDKSDDEVDDEDFRHPSNDKNDGEDDDKEDDEDDNDDEAGAGSHDKPTPPFIKPGVIQVGKPAARGRKKTCPRKPTGAFVPLPGPPAAPIACAPSEAERSATASDTLGQPNARKRELALTCTTRAQSQAERSASEHPQSKKHAQAPVAVAPGAGQKEDGTLPVDVTDQNQSGAASSVGERPPEKAISSLLFARPSPKLPEPVHEDVLQWLEAIKSGISCAIA